jgi:hypothetical protein
MDSRAALFLAFRFWPGFQKLWLKGDFHSLMVSLLFSWVFVIAWLATFVWPEWLFGLSTPFWLARSVYYGLWLAIIVMSLLSATGTFFRLSSSDELEPAERQENLQKAQELYLQANYFDAERLIRKNMFGAYEDVESLLLWIAILRRTRRIPLALELIAQVDKLDAAAPWLSELQTEKEQCLRIKIQTPPAHD